MASTLPPAALPSPASTNPLSSASTSFNSLPPELILHIIPYIPYSPQLILSLRLTCRKLNAVTKRHEHTLTAAFRRHNFHQPISALFPSLATNTYIGLRKLHARLHLLEEVHTRFFQFTSTSPELYWLTGRWEGIYKAGLLLLYRLQDIESCEEKLDLMESLPVTSTACLLFVLVASVKILRVYGPEPICAEYRREDVGVRSDVELACEEVLLQRGPEVFVAMLSAREGKRGSWAVDALNTEIAGLHSRNSSGAPQLKNPTLISSLRRALAKRANCQVCQAVTTMWRILTSTGFDDVGADAEVMGRIVGGQEVREGMRRIF